MTKNAATQSTKLMMSPPRPACRDMGMRVMNSRLPKECRRRWMMPAMAKAQPCSSAYTMYSGMAQNMNMNSSGSVTPVRKTASAVEMNMDL